MTARNGLCGLAVVLLLTAGCTTTPPRPPVIPETSPSTDTAAEERVTPQRDEPKPPPQATVPEPGSTRYATPTASAPVLALLDEARDKAQQGDAEQAAVTLERAIQIEPQNPWLWHRLAVLRLQQGHWDAAIELAKRSNALAKANHRLLGGNWKVIGLAQRGAGHSEAAATALEKSRFYFNAVPGKE